MKLEKIILILLSILCLPIIITFWRSLALGIIASVWLYPLVQKIRKKTNLSLNLTLVILNIIVIFLLLYFVFWSIYVASNQANSLLKFVSQLNFTSLKDIPYIGDNLFNYLGHVNYSDYIKEYGNTFFQKTLTIGSNVFYILISAFICIVWTNILLKSKDSYYENYIGPIYLKYPNLEVLGNTLYKTVQRVGITLVSNAMLTALVMSVVYYNIGLKFVTSLGILTFIAATIPTAMIILLSVLSVVVFLTIGIPQAVILLLCGVILNLFVDQVLQPLLLRKLGANFNLVMSLVGILGGIFCFGLIGVIIGPVLLAIGFESFKMLINEVKK